MPNPKQPTKKCKENNDDADEKVWAETKAQTAEWSEEGKCDDSLDKFTTNVKKGWKKNSSSATRPNNRHILFINPSFMDGRPDEYIYFNLTFLALLAGGRPFSQLYFFCWCFYFFISYFQQPFGCANLNIGPKKKTIKDILIKENK